MTAIEDDDELVGVVEAARRLGIHRQTLYKWYRLGYLKAADFVDARNHRRTPRFRWADLVACQADRRANEERYSTRAQRGTVGTHRPRRRQA